MKCLFSTIVIILIMNINLYSQDYAKKGTWDLGGTVSFSNYQYRFGSGFPVSFSMSPSAGYFITDNFEFGIMPLSVTLKDGLQLDIMLAPAYNFNLKSNLYPFISVLAGYGLHHNETHDGTVGVSGLEYGFEGGVKIQVEENVLININLAYTMYTYNESGAIGRTGYNLLALGAGFSVFFK